MKPLETLLKEYDELAAKLTKAEADLTAAVSTGKTKDTELAALKTRAETAEKLVADLTQERDQLKTANAELTTKMADFDKSVAARCAQLGVRSTPASGAAPSGGSGKMTLTEECLAARGTK